VFGIAYTYGQGRIITAYGPLYGNIFVSVSLLIGTIITGKVYLCYTKSQIEMLESICFFFSGFVKSDLRRQRAYEETNQPEIKSNIKIVIEPDSKFILNDLLLEIFVISKIQTE
jgi:hypothetical protein